VFARSPFTAVLAAALFAALPRAAAAQSEVPRLDHVFVIVFENHAYPEIIGNTAGAPFLNKLAREANRARAYHAVGHPSLPNYLEMVGGSNFGVLGDLSPNWHGASADTLRVRPLFGNGTDAPTPAALTGATNGADIPAARYTAMTIGDQLAAAGKSWKTYQDGLPLSGFEGVDYADGVFSNLSAVSQAGVIHRYAVKHDPFAYFASVQQGKAPGAITGFEGPDGLWADLRAGTAPALSFIVPDQCHDMHGLGDAGLFCATDSLLIAMGDRAAERIVGAIEASPAWKGGKSAIVIVWDENDYGAGPNRVPFILATNYGVRGRTSDTPYNHYSFLRTLELAFGLPCLNHACDAAVRPMTDLFTP